MRAHLRSAALSALAVGLALLGACVSPPLPPATPPGPTAQNTAVADTSATPLPTLALPALTRTPRPLSTIVANIPIHIKGGTVDTMITPRHIVRVLTSDSPLEITVSYPGPVADKEPEVDLVQPSTVRWVTETQQPPDPNTVAFSVAGSGAGIFTLEIAVAGYAPVRFGVQASVPTGVPQMGATPVVSTAEPSPGGPVNAGSSTPASPLASPKTVTLADNGANLTMHVGDRFSLALGEEYDWTVTSGDPAVLSRDVNVLTVRGSQGLYEAHQPGRTSLTADGDPLCRRAQPPCEMPSRQFQVQVIVQ